MKSAKRYAANVILCVSLLSISAARAQTQKPATGSCKAESTGPEITLSTLLAQSRQAARSDFRFMAASSRMNGSGRAFNISPLLAGGPNLSVLGGGTLGRLTKWSGFTSSNSFIGDSTISEDKFGKVGIGTDMPTSRLTVVGVVESTNPGGGFKFPDGTIQTTAGLGSTFHDASLVGNGTSASPLAIAPGGVNSIHLANNAVTAPKIANGTVVRSINGLFDNISILAGSNISITPSGNTVTIAAPNALSSITHNSTLTGDGTAATPLAVAVPLVLSGAISSPIISATNSGSGRIGVFGRGGNSPGEAIGGVFPSGGPGVLGVGGDNQGMGSGGSGVDAFGGDSGFIGGNGISAIGGSGASPGLGGGNGIFAIGGGNPIAGFAGNFIGDVLVQGTLIKTAGSFKIDHPLDPENKYLLHSFVESPDMMNIYNGNVVTDEDGAAVVELPAYFEALNREFRYQLTVIGTFAQAIIAEEIRDNRFVLRTSAPGVKVSWQVTGIRQDAWANKNRIPVEVEKDERQRGYFLHPGVFNQPEERGIEWARNPVLMQQLKQRRVEAEQRLKQ